MRRPLATALAVTATLLGGACGKGGDLVSRPAGKSAPPAPAAPSAPGASTAPGASQQRAYAARVNLLGRDLPGFTPTARHGDRPSPAERRLGGDLRRCLSSGSSTGGGSAPGSGVVSGAHGFSSPRFQRRTSATLETVASEVSFAPSEAVAHEQLRRLRGRDVGRCLTRYFDRLFKAEGNARRLSPVKIAQAIPPAPGTAGGFAMRITTSLAVGSVALPLYVDVLGFVRGTASVTLTSTGVVLPASAALEERLFTLLLARATS